jgi:hypothetical protein
VTLGAQYLEAQRKQYFGSMEALLTQINAATGKSVAIWMGPSQEATSVYTSYKLRDAGSARVLILLIDESEYVPGVEWSFTQATADQIKFEIEAFWDGGSPDRLKVVYIPPKN